MTKQTADLHFTGGGSDKVYHLLQNGTALHVAYGRRGSGLAMSQQDHPTAAKAAAEFTKKFNEKLAKGYQVANGISGNVWGHQVAVDPGTGDFTVKTIMVDDVMVDTRVMTDTRKKAMEKIPSGFLPQLLNEISEEEAQAYLDDDAWGAQEKKNGRRHTVLVDPTNREPRGANKLGFTVPTPVSFNAALFSLQLDGEIIGSKLYAFDLLDLNCFSRKSHPYLQRYNDLLEFHRTYCNDSVELVPLWTSTAAKQELWDRVKSAGGEGVVFKRLDAAHTEGRPNRLGDQLKVIFWQHTQAIVTGITEGKRSVALACYDLAKQVWVPVGNVTIPANYAIPQIGEFVEIRYKYYYEDGSLFQPIYQGARDDCTAMDTDWNKLLRPPEE